MVDARNRRPQGLGTRRQQQGIIAFRIFFLPMANNYLTGCRIHLYDFALHPHTST